MSIPVDPNQMPGVPDYSYSDWVSGIVWGGIMIVIMIVMVLAFWLMQAHAQGIRMEWLPMPQRRTKAERADDKAKVAAEARRVKIRKVAADLSAARNTAGPDQWEWIDTQADLAGFTLRADGTYEYTGADK
jgi:hypothetical protein